MTQTLPSLPVICCGNGATITFSLTTVKAASASDWFILHTRAGFNIPLKQAEFGLIGGTWD